MLKIILASFFERDLHKLIEEINLFKNEDNLWKTKGAVKNSCGNLTLHIIGGLHHFIGATLAHSGYDRDREKEFTAKGVKKEDLIKQLQQLIPMVVNTLSLLTEEEMGADFPIFFDKPEASTSYVLVQLLAHLNYHLGQVNYLRRIVE